MITEIKKDITITNINKDKDHENHEVEEDLQTIVDCISLNIKYNKSVISKLEDIEKCFQIIIWYVRFLVYFVMIYAVVYHVSAITDKEKKIATIYGSAVELQNLILKKILELIK